MQIDAVIWDFDGTILDTEWPAFVSAQREYERVGQELRIEDWVHRIGTASSSGWWEELRQTVGGFNESDEEFLARYRGLKNEMTNSAPLLPGVERVFSALGARNLPCALASSSPIDWVERHTRTRGLWDTFVAVATRTDVGHERTKPEPDLFLLAAERAGFAPDRCLVIEDSHHGVTAAKRAGMYALAVPNRITQIQDFAHADLVVESLEALDLEQLFGSPA